MILDHVGAEIKLLLFSMNVGICGNLFVVILDYVEICLDFVCGERDVCVSVWEIQWFQGAHAINVCIPRWIMLAAFPLQGHLSHKSSCKF